MATELLVAGWRRGDIAKELRVDPSTVWRWFQKPEVIEYRDYLSKQRSIANYHRMREVTWLALRRYAEAISEGSDEMAKDWMHIAMKSSEVSMVAFGG